MIIVKYQQSGVKSVVNDDASDADFVKLYDKWEAKEKEDDGLYVSWLDQMSFEVTHEDWADGHIYRLRPADWPIINGEPK